MREACARAAAMGLMVLAVSLPATARADDTATCNAAYEDADTLVKAGGVKLLDARERLRVCARPTCKAWMVKECTKSLSEVESRIPSVVFVAKDAAGRDVVDIAVTADDKTVATRLDGRAVEIGPGERVFTFTHADGRHATLKAVVREGEKAQRVTVTLEAAAGPGVAPPAPPPPSAPPPAPRKDAVVPPPGAQAGSDGSALRTTGFVLAGVGVVGVAVGTIFGIKAASSKSDAACDAQKECEPVALSSARSSATVATIGFVAGAVLAAGGVTLILIAPSRSAGSARRLEAVPAVAQNEAGLMLRGRW